MTDKPNGWLDMFISVYVSGRAKYNISYYARYNNGFSDIKTAY
ncbi:hypothetical protein GCM10011607_30810 [Shewanella inventionis]|uniref:Uncharacterized protein n=1 Tax=Shewanella inventionis TaxID=1738770 RepID=A0ABQ1JJ18_9GAMM|nr:hypothetical protein GCM10011607_30810 [Shewanella inventionis]